MINYVVEQKADHCRD